MTERPKNTSRDGLDTQARLAALEDAIFESTARQAELTERLRRSEETASTSKAQCESAILEAAAQKERLAGLIDALASSFPASSRKMCSTR